MSKLKVNQIEPRTGDTVSISGDINVSNDTLVVDSTNNRVGIGTSSPTQAGLVIHKYDVWGTRLALKSNETSADTYLRIGRYGTGDDAKFYIGNNYNRDSGGFSADYSSYGVTDINFNNGYLSFGTGAAGQNEPTERMRINANGRVDIYGSLYVNGTPKIGADDLITTLSTLRNATKDETTFEGLRDSLSTAIGGLIEEFEAMQLAAAQEFEAMQSEAAEEEPQ